MKIRIGFITSDAFLPFLKGIEPELEPSCAALYLVARDNREVSALYDSHLEEVDCFVLSGTMFYYALATARRSLAKPAYVLEDQGATLKEALLRLVLARRDRDFSRVFVDFASERNGHLGLKELLPRDQWPRFALPVERPFESVEDIDRYCDAQTERHLELHRSGAIDLSLTRYGPSVGKLEAAGIPFIYVYPSGEYAVNFILQLANAFSSPKDRDAALGCVAIDLGGESRASELLPLLNDLLSAYVREFAYDITVQQEGRRVIVFTRHRDLSRMTRGFTELELKGLVERGLGRAAFLGLGSGSNFYQAKLNAIKAADISAARAGAVFYIDEADIVVGPLRPSGSGELGGPPSRELLAWSKRLGVSHGSLRRILAYARIKGSARISAPELAGFLGVTVRSANRILNRMEEGGGARGYAENCGGGRGRPRKFYDIVVADRV